MAAAAKYRDDVSGAILTGGGAAAYTVATSQGLTALTAGFLVAFSPHATNAAGATLNVDGLGAKPLRTAPGAAGNLGAGVLVQGTPYAASYFASSGGEWILHGFYGSPHGIPLGGLLPYTAGFAPNPSFVLPFGQAISRTTYASYFALVGIQYGTGDGSTTFNVPDLRGRAIFGQDNMGGTTAGRITFSATGIDGITYGASGGAQTLTITAANLPQLPVTISDPGHVHNYQKPANASGLEGGGIFNAYLANDSTFSTTGASTGITATANTGSANTAVNKMPPAMILPFILRVL